MDFIKKIGKEVISNTTGINLGSSSGQDETIYVTAIRAEGIKDKDRLTKSDPYLIVSLGGKSFRTRTINNDLSPQWNETFTFKTSKGKLKDINLKLKDDDYGIDDTIGTAVVSSADFPMYSGEEKYIQIPVKKNEEIHGIVHLRIKRFVEGQQSYLQPPSYSQQQPQQSSYQNYSQQQPQQPQQQQYSSYQNYPQSTQYQQAPPPSYYQQQQQQPQQQQHQAPYYGQPSQYNQQQQYPQHQQYQQNYPSAAGTYSSSSYPRGYNNQHSSQQYPYQQYNQQGYNQGYQR